jgi:hypothetical protein
MSLTTPGRLGRSNRATASETTAKPVISPAKMSTGR